jgi:hypothetical protein
MRKDHRLMITRSLCGFIPLVVVLYLFVTSSCHNDYNVTGVNSPDPGIVQIYLKADDADDEIIIAGDTVKVGDGIDDSLTVHIGQGRAYRGEHFAVLFKNLLDHLERSETHNILKQENGTFVDFLIFETQLPPSRYDSLKIVISADFLQIGLHRVPVEMPEGEETILLFEQNFEINEGRVTAIHLQIKALSSLLRVRDTYQFFPDIEVREIKYL